MVHETGGRFRVAEFFAGIGLMRLGLDSSGGWKTVWANDIDERKFEMYQRAYPGSDDFVLGDIAAVHGSDMPDIMLATASFPCVDLSLAGYRQGLEGLRSGTLWHFTRVLEEMGDRRPPMVLLENVVGFATSKGGADLIAAIERLNALGYSCDVFVVDALHFVPQSRPRLFVVGVQGDVESPRDARDGLFRPPAVARLLASHPELRLHSRPLRLPTRPAPSLTSVIEPLEPTDPRWWSRERVAKFARSMVPNHRQRLLTMMAANETSWGTAYRRTRGSVPRAEVRVDGTAGCLRAMRGGSSRQILVEAGRNRLAVRFMLPIEYARLMGAGEFPLDGLPEHQALFGFGDAVCVPVIKWLAEEYLTPVAKEISARVPQRLASAGG